MQERPTASELLEAVRQHLADELLPTIAAPRQRFRTLVATNVLDVVIRELALVEAQSRAEWERLAHLLAHEGSLPASVQTRRQEIGRFNQNLCERIEAGAFDHQECWAELVAHCQATAREKVAVSNPRFLRRMDREGREAEIKKEPG